MLRQFSRGIRKGKSPSKKRETKAGSKKKSVVQKERGA